MSNYGISASLHDSLRTCHGEWRTFINERQDLEGVRVSCGFSELNRAAALRGERPPSEVITAVEHFVRKVAAVVLERSESTEQDPTVVDTLFRGLNFGENRHATGVRNVLRTAVNTAALEQMIPEARFLQQITAPVAQEISPIIDDEDRGEEQYALVRMLCDSAQEHDDLSVFSEQDVLRDAVLISDHHVGTLNTFAILRERLTAGSYDAYIARNILSAAHKPTEARKHVPEKISVDAARLVSIVQAARDTDRQGAIDFLTKPGMQDLWPERLQRALVDSRYMHVESLDQAMLWGKKWAHILIDAREVGLAEIQGALDRYVGAMALTATTAGGRTAATKGFGQKPNPKKRRKPLQEAAPQNSPETEDNTELRVKNVCVVNPNTGEITTDQTDIDSLMEAIVRDHGNSPSLREDLNTIMSWIAGIDFSTGVIRGVKKYKHLITLNGQQYPVFGLKPNEAVGLSTKWERTRRFRVLFMQLDPETFGLLAVGERDTIMQTERALGMRNAA